MISNKFMVFITFCSLTFITNEAEGKIKSDIFAIINDNTLQRKTLPYTENSSNNNVTNEANFPARPRGLLMSYLSVVTNELNDLNEINEQKFEDFLPLQSAYVELSPDDVKFHSMSYDDFANLKKSSVKMETIIPDGSDSHAIKIICETKINEMVFNGLAEINGTDYDFVINITGPSLKAEYERVLAADGKIVTKSILETLTFKNFTLLIVLSEGNKLVESPNRQILRRLADSWMVTIVNAISQRFVQPNIVEQSQQYFKAYKNNFLQSICSSLFQIPIIDLNIVEPLVDKIWVGDDGQRCAETEIYSFEEIVVNNFQKFENCFGNSMSVQMKKGSSPKHDYFLHNIMFIFTFTTPPSIRWVLKRTTSNRDRYGNYRNPELITNDQNYKVDVEYCSLKLTVLTDKDGQKNNEAEVNIDFEIENYDDAKPNNLTNRFFALYKKSIAKAIKLKFDSIF